MQYIHLAFYPFFSVCSEFCIAFARRFPSSVLRTRSEKNKTRTPSRDWLFLLLRACQAQGCEILDDHTGREIHPPIAVRLPSQPSGTERLERHTGTRV